MAYEVRRFPKGLRNYAAPFLANSKHRKKPPSRFFRRRSRNLLLNYIRRQRKLIWLETHIWHAKRFHIIDRWGYRLPDRSFQRNFRPCYRDSVRHCTVRDKSYLSCFLISHDKQEELISVLSALCVNAASPTFAFKSGLEGRYEVSTLIYHPGQYPRGLIGPARFLWSKDGDVYNLALWVHPSCRDEVLGVLKQLLELVEEETGEEDEKPADVPQTVEEWRLSKIKVRTDSWSGKLGIRVQDLRDQLVRIRLYGPLSASIVSDALKLVEDEKASDFRENHSEWRENVSKLATGCLTDGSVLSLLVEDPRISRPSTRKVPVTEALELTPMESYAKPKATFWNKDVRLKALADRLTDSELNALKGKCLGQIKETPAKIPVLVVFRSGGSGRGDTLSGCELIVPCGFGMDFWVAMQLRTARASGWRDELTAHLEASRLCFPTDVIDAVAGADDIKRMGIEQEVKYDRRPHNRRVNYWRKLSIKYPFTFDYSELVADWLRAKGKQPVDQPYVLRERVALLTLSRWMQGRGKVPEELLATHFGALIPVELQCIARGKPRRYGLVCLPTKDDLDKIQNRHKNGPVIIVQEPRGSQAKVEVTGAVQTEKLTAAKADIWKDIVSIDQSTREKPVPLKELFPDSKVVDKTLKRRIANRKKRESAKRRRVDREGRLKEWNADKEEKESVSYRESANRLVVGRIIRGDFSFCTACGRALSYIPVCALEDIRKTGGIVLLRNSTSKYYHPARINVLNNLLEI